MIQYEGKIETQVSPKIKRESKSYFIILIYKFFLFPLGKLSNASTFYSLITKESEETKFDKTISGTINLNFNRKINSSPKFTCRKINLFSFNTENKSYKSKDNKKQKCPNENIKSKEKYELINTNNIKDVNIKPPPETPKKNDINNIRLKNNRKENLSKIVNKDEKLNIESYSQNFNISCMKKCPPKLPDMFNHEHNLQNNDIGTKSNCTYGQLSKGLIPNIFFGHWMVDCNQSCIGFMNKDKKNKKYFKSSATQRNKKKLLTIIYYAPL